MVVFATALFYDLKVPAVGAVGDKSPVLFFRLTIKRVGFFPLRFKHLGGGWRFCSGKA